MDNKEKSLKIIDVTKIKGSKELHIMKRLLKKVK